MLAELRRAFRALRKSAALAATAVISLALGIGANVTVFSVVQQLILDDVSAAHPGRLARLDATLSYSEYRDLRHSGIFQDLAFDAGLRDATWRQGDRRQIVWLFPTSPNFFQVLGIRAAAGRLYAQADEGRAIAAVSYGFWLRRLGADPAALGRVLEIGGRLYTVAAILPRDYHSILGHGVSPEIYFPTPPESNPRCHPFARLRDGMSRSAARQALAAAVPSLGIPRFARELPGIRPFSGLAANAASQGDEHRFFVFFGALFGLAAILALIACSNVAGLLVARRISRQRETAIRRALGANRLQLARPLLAEAAILVAGGAAAGLALDAWLRSRLAYVRWPSAFNIPIEFHFPADRTLFLYALVTAGTAFAICSLAGAGERSLAAAVKPRSGRWNPQYGLVALQVVLSMVLLTLGALFTRAFLHLANAGPGFDAAHTLIVAVHPPAQDAAHGFEWRERQAAAVRAVPGVVSVSSADQRPLMGEVLESPVRRLGAAPSAARDVYSLAVGEDYFATLRIPLLRGREFTIADRGRTPVPAIVNRTLASQFFGAADPIGAIMMRGRDRPDALVIVGVAADSKLRTLGEAAAPAVYTPQFNAQFIARAAGNPASWIGPIGRALAGGDATLEIRPMSDAVAGAIFPMRMAAAFVGSLGTLGLALALVGIYGSVAYAVSRRTREMGIRAALGATEARLLATAAREAACLTLAGVAAGVPLALSAVRPLANLMPDGLNPWDPRLFAAAAAVLIATSLAAAAMPARRAARADPAQALRTE